MENSLAVPQKVNHTVTRLSNNSTSRYYPKELKARIQTDTRTPIFMAALLTMARKWKQLKCPSADAWIGIYTQWNIIQP